MKAVARAGRKRKQNVVRFPCGKPIKQEALIMPFNTHLVRLTGDGKLGNKRGLERVTDVLEFLNITKSQRLAGQEFASLREACARFAWGSPAINAKICNPHASHAHDSGEMSEAVVDMGAALHKKYIRAVSAIRRSGRHVLPVMAATCFENKMPTSEDRPLLYRGLNALVRLWNL